MREQEFHLNGQRLSPWLVRPLASLLTFFLFFSGSPALFALQFSAAGRSGDGQAGGGQGSSPSLQGAGAASAALTAALTQKSLQKSQSVITALTTAQKQAAIAAKANPNNGQVNGKSVINGLQLSKPAAGNGQVAGLVPYYTAQNPAPSGSQVPTGAVPIPGTWSGVAGLSQTISGSSSAPSSSSLTITQNQQSAYLYWSSFNVGAQTTLNFRQSGNLGTPGTWIAFNKVMGSSDPSHIFGQINSPGQVYILNQNGVLFHAGSEVNVQSLVAAALPINAKLAGDALDRVTASGLVNFPNSVPQYLFTALDKGSYDPNNAGNVMVGASLGNVVLEPGATINATVNAEHSGGLVALIGPSVQNGGEINTPNGQTILAAGLQVALTPHPSSDPSLRGLDVSVGQITGNNTSGAPISVQSVKDGSDMTSFAGVAENTSHGLITANEGDVTIAGSTVNQQGGIASTTSVAFNGRVDLLANYGTKINLGYKADGSGGPTFYNTATGSVDIGSASAMQILPEWGSSAMITGTSLALNSLVSILGSQVDMASGSILLAPGARSTPGAIAEDGKPLGSTSSASSGGVTIQAGSWYRNGTINDLQFTAGGITLGSGAIIDLSGSTDVQVNSAQNYITLQLRAAELANSPLQQLSAIRGQNIMVDSRVTGQYTLDGTTYYWAGTPLGDTSGYLGLIQRTIGQLTLDGGTLSLQAGDTVSLQPGSLVNVSGGWMRYSGGNFATTKLITSTGQIVDISKATPDQIYTGVVQHTPMAYEAPYLSGGNGGSVRVQSPSIMLNGDLNGNTVAGLRQSTHSSISQAPPLPSVLSLSFLGQRWDPNAGTLINISPSAPSVTFAANRTSTSENIYISPELVQADGFGNLTIHNHDGTISLPSGTLLNAGINGSVSLEAANVDIEGSIVAAGGLVSLKADLAPFSVINSASLIASSEQPLLDVVQFEGHAAAQYGPVVGGVTQIVNADGSIRSVSAVLPHENAGIVTIGNSSVISVAGTLVRDSSSLPQEYQPISLNGGSLSITGYQVNAKSGSQLDVSGGAIVPLAGSSTYGNAGSVSIVSGKDMWDASMHNGSLAFNGTLAGFSGLNKTPGSLSITAPAIQIGGTTQDQRVLLLKPSFFNQGGFGSFSLTGVGLKPDGVFDGLENPSSDVTPYVPGILIVAGTTIHPMVSSLIVSGTPSQGITVSDGLLPNPLRPTETISLNAIGLNDSSIPTKPNLLIRGDLVMEKNASINLDPQLGLKNGTILSNVGSLKLSGNTVSVLGSITVPGGSISLSGGKSFRQNSSEFGPEVTVDVASSARLSTAGQALFLPDTLNVGKKSGSVLSGGAISISGNILAESGATLNASGSRGVYDFLPSQLGLAISHETPSMVAYQVDSAGGSINLNGGQMLYSDAKLAAHRGGATAQGGSLNISSGNFYNTTLDAVNSFKDINLTITQDGQVAPAAFQDSGVSAIGQQLFPTSALNSANGGHLAVDSFSGGGFDGITLGGNVLFNGAQSGGIVSITVPGSIRVATAGFLGASGNTFVNLKASLVSLGMAFHSPLSPGSSELLAALGTSTYAAPTWGQGSLNVDAKVIDIGNLSLQGIGHAKFNAPNGVIRGDGTFDLAGSLTINSAMVYPLSETAFNLIAYNYSGSTAVSSSGTPGSILINQSGSMQLPLSAGGAISLYAENIVQGGTVIAPIGSVNLGWEQAGASPVDPITGAGTGDATAIIRTVPVTETLGLLSGSLTSISGVDPVTGKGLIVPYGTSTGGSKWVDLSGTDITTIGLPSKSIQLGANNIASATGSKIDLSGGGSAIASHWVAGNGGTINIVGDPKGGWSPAVAYSIGDLVTTTDGSGKFLYWTARQANYGTKPSVSLSWSQVQPSYAVVPGYQPAYAPSGYSDGLISLGSQIQIKGGVGLAAGTYTLLPASYASQPGAYLISPSALNLGAGSYASPDGSVITSGTIFNGLDFPLSVPLTVGSFQILSPQQIARRAQYQNLNSDTFFQSSAGGSRTADAGNLVYQANASMALNASVLGLGAGGGKSARIDISAPLQFSISPDGTGGVPGVVDLSSSMIDLWSFGSLLIGGIRGPVANGLTPITVTASDVNLAPGALLSGSDVILAANNSVTVGAGSSIVAYGGSQVPDESLSVSGNGEILRVSSDKNATSSRNIGADSTSVSGLSIQAGANLSGASITIDSSGAATIDPSVIVSGQTINVTASKVALNFDGTQEPGSVLNINGRSLKGLSAAQSLNISSYSSIDFHGSGTLGSAALTSLGLHAGEILGDNGGADAIQANNILLDNANNTAGSGSSLSASGGALTISGSLLTLGAGALEIGDFQTITMSLSGGIVGNGKGSLAVAENLNLSSPILTGTGSSSTRITAGGSLDASASGSSLLKPGLGASLALQGNSLNIGMPITLPSGSVSLEATGPNGDLTLSSVIDVGGSSKQIFNATVNTSGGAISLFSENGNLILAGSSLNVAALASGGSAGNLSFMAPSGLVLSMPSVIAGTAPHGSGGNFVADLGSYNHGNLDPLETILTAGGFTQSQNVRDRTDQSIFVTDAKAGHYTLAADQGSITILGTINASDVPGKDSLGNPIQTGGSINLIAGQSVVISSGATLNVSGQNYDNSGKGGSITLEAGNNPSTAVSAASAPSLAFAEGTSVVDLQSGATLNLAIAAAPRAIDAAGNSDQFSGKLHVRAPQTRDASDVQVNPIGATISGASLITVEGFYRQDAAQSDSAGISSIDNMEDAALINAAAFMNNAPAVASRLLSQSGAFSGILQVAPGEEIVNSLGSLMLNNDWDLSAARFGPNNVPGFLALRAAGSIIFNASLSDGFSSQTFDPTTGNPILGSAFNAPLLAQNTVLPANFQSWAYQVTAGGDFSAANSQSVINSSQGSVLLGIPYQNGSQVQAPVPGAEAQTADAIAGPGYNYYQVIRTGTGDIAINASGNLQLWNQFASIYSVGTQVTDPTLEGAFDTPSPSNYAQNSPILSLGGVQQAVPFATQFNYAGGNITVSAKGNIGHWSLDASATPGSMIADSGKELPSNWLYRRGSVDANGKFSILNLSPDTQGDPKVRQVASTSWWVDFSNFFDDFGALGGGNITLNAGGNISNINAAIPTNFRMRGRDSLGNLIQASTASGIELGGGNLAVSAGNNIDAGVYYLERGNGILQAGGSIITNPTRDPSAPSLTAPVFANAPLSYLPSTLFLGKGSFNVLAGGDVLIGPVANVFMTPQGINNGFWLSDYFSTYAPTDKVSVLSFGGNVTFRESAANQASQAPLPLLQSWISSFLNPSDSTSASYYQPWLRVVEADISSDSIPSSSTPVGLGPLLSLMPASLDALAISGDINLQGNLTLMPSAIGSISFIADENINGLVENGIYKQSATSSRNIYAASTVNVSDANPSLFPGINSPLSKRSSLPSTLVNNIRANGTKLSFTTDISTMLFESGSINGQYATLASKSALHDSSLLHAEDQMPSQMYAGNGNISGIKLFSPKATLVAAGQDITDIGFYFQNDSAKSVSIVSAGRNITAYDPSSPLQKVAQAAYSGSLQSGDVQISGPGTLEVLAGGNIDLGNNPGADGDSSLNVGIMSIGNQRNPSLPFQGADISVSAGVKLPSGFSSPGGLALDSFAQSALSTTDGSTYLSELSAQMAYTGDPLLSTLHTAADFGSASSLSTEQRARLEMQLFYIVLRDTGRNYSDPKSAGYRSYATARQAIQTVMNGSTGSGNITTWSQDIATANGGNLDLFTPGGGVTMGSINYKAAGSSVAPGIITEGGGAINIFTKQNVDIGIGRIFTLKGGDIMIWSDQGNIAAGASSKTVQSAPPTQVLVDPQSALVEADLAGLATGGGIGTLQTVIGIAPSAVDLDAPSGVIDAGDAGIRSSGNLHLAATAILNAANIQVGGLSVGVPPPAASSAPAAAPAPAPAPASAPSSASTAAAAASSAADKAADKTAANQAEETPSVFSIDIMGYGGGDGDGGEGSDDQNKKAANSSSAPIQASL